ncbi:MAG: ATP-binding protein, partial [Pseudomonadota bacterium]
MFGTGPYGGLILTATILVLLITLTVVVTPFALGGILAYVGYRLYKESPARAERIAREETMALYTAACAQNQTLTEAEIEQALTSAWPSRTPTVLRLQLLGIGQALFEAEGLTPEIPPPPPLHNTVEAARYRDQLAKLETARRDKGMALEALRSISHSLAPIAQAVPPMEGDVLVEVSQFLEPLGETVQAVIAPYFADRDYDLFKPLKDRLSQNLGATHRSNPVFPRDYRGEDVVPVYLRGTLLEDLFALKTPFAIPEEVRFEHTHLVAGSGHGKTQTLQYLIR